MLEHRYILEPYKGMKTRYQCPSCQQREKTFSRYIDNETGKHLHPTVGKCNRENNCGYHYTPKQYFQETGTLSEIAIQYARARAKAAFVPPKPKRVSFISEGVFNASLNRNEKNHFVSFLTDLFGLKISGELVSQYFIGTSKHWNAATVFWQLDTQGKVRTGKIMLYNPSNGKRIKKPYKHITWVHFVLNLPEFELQQCLFGEQLLKDTTKPIAIVESEKTAVIASVYLPQFIWLAAGSLSNLNAEKCKVLRGRNVVLFPDLNCFEKWSQKAKELSQITSISVSDLLERNATAAEKQQGLDLADYLLKFDFRQFNEQYKLKPAFVTNTGELMIETPFADTYSIYPSISHYNERKCLPALLNNAEVKTHSRKPVFIDLQTLTIQTRNHETKAN